jgi:hypothetical protein
VSVDWTKPVETADGHPVTETRGHRGEIPVWAVVTTPDGKWSYLVHPAGLSALHYPHVRFRNVAAKPEPKFLGWTLPCGAKVVRSKPSDGGETQVWFDRGPTTSRGSRVASYVGPYFFKNDGDHWGHDLPRLSPPKPRTDFSFWGVVDEATKVSHGVHGMWAPFGGGHSYFGLAKGPARHRAEFRKEYLIGIGEWISGDAPKSLKEQLANANERADKNAAEADRAHREIAELKATLADQEEHNRHQAAALRSANSRNFALEARLSNARKYLGQ